MIDAGKTLATMSERFACSQREVGMISVQSNDFDVAAEYAALTEEDVAAGAVVLFVGRVREMGLSSNVTGLTLEHYPGMTEKALNEIINEAKARWEIIRCRIIHRIGVLTL